MNYLKIIGTFFCLLLFFISKPLSLENKILFKINNEIISTIDLYNETKYLTLLNLNLSVKVDWFIKGPYN